MEWGSQRVANRLRGLTARQAGLAVAFWGEPGIGKTHLAKVLLKATLCSALGVRATQPLDYVASGSATPEAARSIERLEAREVFTGEQLVEILAAQLALGAQLVLHAEDVHECSPDQLRLWNHLAVRVTRIRGAGLLVISRTPLPEGFEAVRVLCRI